MVQQKRAKFGSKLGLILATAGGAVGLGNVWRFPYMAGQNGGAAFILLYIGCILLLGLPCMVSEFIIGRHAASNTARAYTKLSDGTAWKWVGYLRLSPAGVFSTAWLLSWAICMDLLRISSLISPTFPPIRGNRFCGRLSYFLSPTT